MQNSLGNDSLSAIQFVDETGVLNGGAGPFVLDTKSGGSKRSAGEAGLDDSDSDSDLGQQPITMSMLSGIPGDGPKPGKKTKGRVKIKMEFIENKLRRYTTFSKRKTGIMKKAYELSTLTGTQVMLLVASETGHVYTFATRKLQPMITSESGKALIQTCLNSPDLPNAAMNTAHAIDQRMNPGGFEETELTYAVGEEDGQRTEEPLSLTKSFTDKSPWSVYQPDSPPPAHMPKPMAAVYATTQVASPAHNHSTSGTATAFNLTQSSQPVPVAMAVTSTASTKQQGNSITMQLPSGGITALLPQGLRSGTPITISPENLQQQQQQHQQQQQQGQQVSQPQQQATTSTGPSTSLTQQMYRLQTVNGQIMSIPANMSQAITAVTSSVKTDTTSQTSSTTAAAPVTIMPNATVASDGQTVIYQMPQGLVYAAAAAPSAAALSAIPEGYILNLQQPGLQGLQGISTDAQGQQYVTIPVSGSQGAMLQPILTTQSVTSDKRKT